MGKQIKPSRFVHIDIGDTGIGIILVEIESDIMPKTVFQCATPDDVCVLTSGHIKGVLNECKE